MTKIFNDYFNKRLKNIKKSAKTQNITAEKWLQIYYGKTLFKYRVMLRKRYNGKECHSFFRRECINKDRECYHCDHYYSTAQFDKMTKKQRIERGWN